MLPPHRITAVGAITPNVEQFQQLANAPDTGPVVMINLLKFRENGVAADSGAAEYRRYGDVALEMIEAQGGRLLWAGTGDQVLIGDAEQQWDAVLLVEYPSRAAFIEMVSTPEYLDAHAHRERALERTVVIACSPVSPDDFTRAPLPGAAD
jgi:uncharacterized protein (DUF1330 family)